MYEEDFESEYTTTTIDGKSITVITSGSGIWMDGGSNSYPKTSEYMTGGTSYLITKQPNLEKPYYGSIYTKVFDFSGTDQVVQKYN